MRHGHLSSPINHTINCKLTGNSFNVTARDGRGSGRTSSNSGQYFFTFHFSQPDMDLWHGKQLKSSYTPWNKIEKKKFHHDSRCSDIIAEFPMKPEVPAWEPEIIEQAIGTNDLKKRGGEIRTREIRNCRTSGLVAPLPVLPSDHFGHIWLWVNGTWNHFRLRQTTSVALSDQGGTRSLRVPYDYFRYSIWPLPVT